jgi:D-lyxose ketol-isomerase
MRELFGSRWIRMFKTGVFSGILLVFAGMAGCANTKCCPALQPEAKQGAQSTGRGGQDMYKDGKLDIEAVKQAYFEMFDAFKYPVPEILKTEAFWVADFVQGDILSLGMGGVFWINESGTYGTHGSGAYAGEFGDQKFGYLGHEIFLLPGQTLPEHRHIGGSEGFGPKMEAWQVRYGSVTFYGEYRGEGTEVPLADLSEDARPWGYGEDWFRSKYGVVRDAASGKPYVLKAPESWHGMRAGKHGAIVTEYATYHNHVEFSKPGMVFGSTGH